MCYATDSYIVPPTYHAVTVDADGAGNICINCTQSDALGCVVLLHPVNDLSNITVREVNRHLQQPYCIHVGRNIFSVAVFEWKKDGFLSFQPAVFKITTFDQPSKCYNYYKVANFCMEFIVISIII